VKSYEKTVNLYKRYPEGHTAQGRYNVLSLACPEFAMVRPGSWIITEKIDGENLGIILKRNPFSGDVEHEVRGRRTKSTPRPELVEVINEMIYNRRSKLEQLVPFNKDEGITLYGEGYGPRIQKHGELYRDTPGFILFDIARWDAAKGTQYFLARPDMVDIAENCGLTVVPTIMHGAGLSAMTLRVREGILSTQAYKKGGERAAEGIVAQAPGLWFYNDGGLRRLKFKLKTKDFPR
jgi:hypothetical protein